MADHLPRKRFGQHFLVEQALIRRIVDEVDPRDGDALVEIGPGLGALTLPLLARVPTLAVIELDRDLAARWRRHAAAHGTPRVIEADALDVDFAALAREAGRPLRVVGNLPYNVSTPILFHLLDAAGVVADQHVMLQKEVVQRIVAAPGGRAFGRLSVMLQWRYRTELLLEAPPQAFDPPPKVDSAVLRMVPRPAAEVEGVPQELLREIVTAAFSQRRKLLRHSLGRWLAGRGEADPGFDLARRAEEVPVAEYLALARRLA